MSEFEKLVAVAERSFDDGVEFDNVNRAITLCMEARLVRRHVGCSLSDAIALLRLSYKLEPQDE